MSDMIGNDPIAKAVAQSNSTANNTVSDVIGNKDDNVLDGPGTSSLYGIAAFMAFYHTHDPSLVYPRDANPTNVVSGAGAWLEGTKVEIIPAGIISNSFDIHFVILGNISVTGDFVIKLYTGALASEVFWAECAFTRDTNQVRGSQVPIQGAPIPANTRVSASLLSNSTPSNVDIKLYTHKYPV